jgi:hypothetical protein
MEDMELVVCFQFIVCPLIWITYQLLKDQFKK